MRVSFLWFITPFSLVGFFIITAVASAQISEGMLIEERMVSPPHPPETPRHHKVSADQDESKSLNAMDEDDAVDQVAEGEEISTCIMEVQEIRRIPGRCVSLGRRRGCVAGNYLDPTHHECL